MTLLGSTGLRGLLVGIAPLALTLVAPWGCSSEPEATTQAGGNSSTAAGAPATTSSAGAPAGSGNASAGKANSSGSAGESSNSAGASAGGASGGAAAEAGGTSSGGATAGASTGGAAGRAGAGGGGATGGGTKPIKVWIAGDSTVQNCSGACPCGWGSQFDPLFNNNVTVVNSAVGGRSILSWLYEASVGGLQNGECSLTSNTYDKRWSDMLDANSGMKAGDFLFIQFGINDTAADCPKHVSTERFKTLLGTMAKAATDRGAQPVFVTPVSAIICTGAVAQPTRGRFVDATKEAATANNVPLLDLHQLSIDLFNARGFCPNDENYGAGKVGDFFCQDHTHFEAAGAKAIAGLVAGALPTTGPALAAYLK